MMKTRSKVFYRMITTAMVITASTQSTLYVLGGAVQTEGPIGPPPTSSAPAIVCKQSAATKISPYSSLDQYKSFLLDMDHMYVWYIVWEQKWTLGFFLHYTLCKSKVCIRYEYKCFVWRPERISDGLHYEHSRCRALGPNPFHNHTMTT